MQGKSDAHGVIGEVDAAVAGAIEHTGIEQRVHIRMDRLDVAAEAPRDTREWSSHPVQS